MKRKERRECPSTWVGPEDAVQEKHAGHGGTAAARGGGGGLEGGVHGDGEQQGGWGPGARGRNGECVTGTEFQLGK